MTTLKRLKILTIFQILYCIFCVLSCTFFWIYDCTENYWLFGLGVLSMYGWCVNPIGPITLIGGLSTYWKERKNEEDRNIVGMKWIWFLIWPVVDSVLFFVSGDIMVGITGGV